MYKFLYKTISQLSDQSLQECNAIITLCFPSTCHAIHHFDDFDACVSVLFHNQHAGLFLVKREGVAPYIQHNIQKLCVHPQFRRQGVATCMLMNFLNRLTPHESAYLHVDAGTRHDYLVSFYQSFGFQVVSNNAIETCLFYSTLI